MILVLLCIDSADAESNKLLSYSDYSSHAWSYSTKILVFLAHDLLQPWNELLDVCVDAWKMLASAPDAPRDSEMESVGYESSLCAIRVTHNPISVLRPSKVVERGPPKEMLD